MNNIILPQGDRIRQLLTKSNVTNSNINSLLRSKGVFLGHNEKNNSIPNLMKTIISPDEFKELYETQKSKEDTVKFRTATIKCREDLSLKEVFAEDINLQQKIIEAHKYKPTFKVIGTPSPYFEDNKAIYEYKIERENLLEDWTNNKTYHTGAVIITKTGGNLELSVEQNSTSKETHLINEILTKEIRNILDKKSLINDKDDFIRIKFNDFDNVNRIQFLYSFTNNFCIYLDFVSITDINLLLDENEESHKDVKPFLDEIDSLKLNGKVLQNHILLKNNTYHQKLIFASISLKYKFNINGVKGVCVIDISFPDYISKRDLNSELQISINFNVNREHRKMASETQLRKELYSYIERNKIKNYQKYRAE
jgi:hypothetical protein